MRNDPISIYFQTLEKAFLRGDATEHTYRPALKALVECLGGTGTTATNEPKRVECGAPDYVVSRGTKHGPVTLGHIEAKDIGEDLAGTERSEQLKRYLSSLPNLILTDYLEFRWYVDGERRLAATLGCHGKGKKFASEKGGEQAVVELLGAFLAHQPEPIGTAKDLAVRMAKLTRFIRNMIVESFEKQVVSDTVRDLHKAFEMALLPELKTEDFADMFAQTLAYGLFAARCNHQGVLPFRRLGAAAEIPKTNPFLRQLFDTITGTALDDEPFVGFVDDLAQLLSDTDMHAVLADFGRRTARQDPVVHFYETYLAEYDQKLREARGVYYTPEPVVSYIVRSVDSLLKTRFGCADGLADTSTVSYKQTLDDGSRTRTTEASAPRVLVLDPACGTGTFLYSIVDHIRENFKAQNNAGMWAGYVSEHILPRLFGFELLMAPYAVAHFKLGMQLAGHDMNDAERSKWAWQPTGDRRLGIYLTNTLEEAEKRAKIEFGFLRTLGQEAAESTRIKKVLPIMVVMGNPPYSGHSANRSWEMEVQEDKTKKGRTSTAPRKRRVPTFIGKLLQDYYQVDGQPLGERNPKWLQDDYVKFIRFGQWRIEQTGQGILAFITNHGYLDNPTFRGMRRQLMKTFDEIFVLDLHGNAKKKEVCPDGSKDQNVFDIQQGVAIGIFVKRGSHPAGDDILGGADTPVRASSKKADKSVRPTKDPGLQGTVTSDLQIRQRDLPHWQQGGSVYFVTFRSARGELPPEARRPVISSALHDHGKKYDVIFGVVMPDHVHLLLRPMETDPGVWHDLHKILKSVKGVSARRINQLLGTSGTVWQDESFDRIVRDAAEFREKFNYMLNNPVKAGLVERAEDYEFYIHPPATQVEEVPSGADTLVRAPKRADKSVRPTNDNSTAVAKVRHADLWGLRDTVKYPWLSEHELQSTQ